MAILEGIDMPFITRVFTSILALSGILVCLILLNLHRRGTAVSQSMRLVHIPMTVGSAIKLLSVFGFFIIPTFAVTTASYQMFVGTKDVSACVRCHVMRPMANDMQDPSSENLAAKHFRNRWINEQQCYHCHTDYGLSGTIEAKMSGLRHLLRYTTHTYHEPITHSGGTFDNRNCLHCHEGTPKYSAIAEHTDMHDVIVSNDTSCTTCHGDAHPSKAQRSPGSADYDRLMQEVKR